MVLDAADFQSITDSALKVFDERVASVDLGTTDGFAIEVARLESQVVQLYGIAALLARRETELEKIAEIWGAMIATSDAVAKNIRTHCPDHPACAASYDKILDIRNKATRLRDLHGATPFVNASSSSGRTEPAPTSFSYPAAPSLSRAYSGR